MTTPQDLTAMLTQLADLSEAIVTAVGEDESTDARAFSLAERLDQSIGVFGYELFCLLNGEEG